MMNVPAQIVQTPTRYRLSVADFLLLDTSGAFAHFARAELIDGEIFGMNAQHAGHARVKTRLAKLLADRLAQIGSDLEVIVEVTIRIADDSAPEPDIVVTSWRGEGLIPSDTIALVVEVADTTLGIDLGRKADLYAAAGIPEYWVIDLTEDRILGHELPEGDNYAGQLDMPIGGPMYSATIDGLEIDTGALLG